MTESDEEVIAAAERFGISGLLTKEQFDHLVALARRGAAIPDVPTEEMQEAASPRPAHWDKTDLSTRLRLHAEAIRADDYRAMIAKALEPRT